MEITFLIILLISVVAVAQRSYLSCSYSVSGTAYDCYYRIYNPENFNDFTEIEGVHVPGFTNDDVTYLENGYVDSSIFPSIICETFPNIVELYLYRTEVTEIDDNSFNKCSRLVSLHVIENKISSISPNAFMDLRGLTTISLQNNLITELPENVFAGNLFEDSFVGLEQSLNINLDSNAINEIPIGIMPNVGALIISRNNIRELPESAFAGLTNLIRLRISNNPLESIHANAFKGLKNLQELSMSSCNFSKFNSSSIKILRNLLLIDLSSNGIEELEAGAFATMANLEYINLRSNRLQTLDSNSFGTLTNLKTLDLGENALNALDRFIIDDAANLNLLYFGENVCASFIYKLDRAEYLPMLETCFSNFEEFSGTLATDGDSNYRFFDAPNSGIALRVHTNGEIQIALLYQNFVVNPMIEIFIGAANNTESVIRLHQTDVVSASTADIIAQDQWNDFTITWAIRNVYVFRGSDLSLPFMTLTVPEPFPIYYYGLRSVETRAFWRVLTTDEWKKLE